MSPPARRACPTRARSTTCLQWQRPIPDALRNEIKSRVGALRERHQAWGEIKWSKVSPNRRDFYVELIDLFFAYGDNLRFRCIAVDRTQLNLALHDNDGELGFYKFYYQLLHHWILDFNA